MIFIQNGIILSGHDSLEDVQVIFGQLLSKREALIAKLCLQGAKRIREVLNLQIEHVDLHKKQATFIQSKTRGLFKKTVVTISEHLAHELRDYIGERSTGFVFITSTKMPVRYTL